MEDAWRVVAVVVMIAVMMAVIAVGVGLLTGGSTERVFRLLEQKYQVVEYAKAYITWIVGVYNAFMGALFG